MGLAQIPKRTLLIALLVISIPFVALNLHFVLKNYPAPTTGNASVLRQQERAGLPLRIRIPKIGVDAALENVGLTLQGDLDAPKGTVNAGWYDQGPRPGEMGSAVIDGHFGSASGKPAVFDNLHSLLAGDKLYIEDEKGVIIVFVVRGSKTYNPEADTSDIFKSNLSSSRLNLITCQGDWIDAQKSYSNRLVVFADKELE